MRLPEAVYNHSINPARQRLWHLLLLALPFLSVIVYSKGLSDPLPVARYLTYDEGKFHYPTIIQFAKDFPFFSLSDYYSATTPLYHILMSLLHIFFNADLAVLRWATLVISFLAITVLYKILVKRLGINRGLAFFLTLIFGCSPYFFGASFVVQPGNFAVLLFLLSINSYLKFKGKGKLCDFVWSMLFIMLCLLCRQTYLYVVIAIGFDLLLRIKSTKLLLVFYSIMMIALIPLAWLIMLWKGLTPPTFIHAHTEAGLVNLKSITFALVVLGFYAFFLLPYSFYSSISAKKLPIFIGIFVASILVLILFPLTGDENVISGNLPRIATKLPSISNNSILYLLLMPAGVVALYLLIKEMKLHFFVLLLVCFFVSNLPSKIVFERYFDTSIILVLIFANTENNIQGRWSVLLRVMLMAIFIGHFLTYKMLNI